MAYSAQDIAHPVPQPQVQQSLDRLAQTIESMSHNVESLIQKLAPAMRSEPPSPANAKEGPTQVVSKAPLSEIIDNAQRRIDAANAHLLGIIDRLEI